MPNQSDLIKIVFAQNASSGYITPLPDNSDTDPNALINRSTGIPPLMGNPLDTDGKPVALNQMNGALNNIFGIAQQLQTFSPYAYDPTFEISATYSQGSTISILIGGVYRTAVAKSDLSGGGHAPNIGLLLNGTDPNWQLSNYPLIRDDGTSIFVSGNTNILADRKLAINVNATTVLSFTAADINGLGGITYNSTAGLVEFFLDTDGVYASAYGQPTINGRLAWVQELNAINTNLLANINTLESQIASLAEKVVTLENRELKLYELSVFFSYVSPYFSATVDLESIGLENKTIISVALPQNDTSGYFPVNSIGFTQLSEGKSLVINLNLDGITSSQNFSISIFYFTNI